MVRLKDIALRAGVSVMTVSKALRDAPDISVETKSRIRVLTQQMGYVPDSLAQSLRTRKTNLLGLVIPAITNPIYSRVLMAIEQTAYGLGYAVVLSHSLNQPEREETVIRRLLSRRIDGLIVAPVYRMDPTVPIFEELLQRGTPTLILGHQAPFCRQFVSVETDDLEGSRAITQHLLKLGHRRIAFFAGPSASPWAQERLEGYRRALREAEIEVDDHLVFNAGGTIEEGEKAALQMLSESPQVTAVQAANDLVAMGAANALLSRGIRIPDDLSLAGFGNFLASEYFRIPLTTIRQPKFRLGTALVETLMLLIRGERPATRRLLGELVARASTAPPPGIPAAPAAPAAPATAATPSQTPPSSSPPPG